MKILSRKKLINTICITLTLLISTPSVFALPPDPDNAALLYYQAYILYEKSDETMQDMVYDLSAGKIEPNPRIIKYIETCRPAIELAATAAEMPNCDWGLKYSDGLSMQLPSLAQNRNLGRLIIADARILVAQGDYDSAINRCLSFSKMARHIGSEPLLISCLVSLALDNMTNECIRDILADMPEDLETLTWLKNQLAKISNRPSSFKAALDIEREVMASYLTEEKIRELIPLLLGEIEENESEEIKIANERILAADEEFCQRNRNYWENYFTAVKAALNLAYAQAFAELKKAEEKVKKDVIENPDATGTALLAGPFARICSQEVKAKTFSNAIKAAIDVYIKIAETGQLPDSLPADSPVDPFSGKPFEYQKSNDGFVLRCHGKDLYQDKIHQYEFKVTK